MRDFRLFEVCKQEPGGEGHVVLMEEYSLPLSRIPSIGTLFQRWGKEATWFISGEVNLHLA